MCVGDLPVLQEALEGLLRCENCGLPVCPTTFWVPPMFWASFPPYPKKGASNFYGHRSLKPSLGLNYPQISISVGLQERIPCGY